MEIARLLNKRQYVENYFAELDFNEEAHRYKYRGRVLYSVSSVIKRCTPVFDADKIAGYVARSRNISKAEVLAEWEDIKNKACDFGTKVHLFGERYRVGDIPEDGHEQAIVKFWDEVPKHIVPFMFELQMFSEELGIAGTADIILYNTRTGNFIIADYKTNKDLFKNHKNQTLLAPFQDKLDMPLSKYDIQLSFYKHLFEQCGFKVEACKVVWLKPDGSYELYNSPDLIDKALTLL